jgi:hypothetical protein
MWVAGPTQTVTTICCRRSRPLIRKDGRRAGRVAIDDLKQPSESDEHREAALEEERYIDKIEAPPNQGQR